MRDRVKSLIKSVSFFVGASVIFLCYLMVGASLGMREPDRVGVMWGVGGAAISFFSLWVLFLFLLAWIDCRENTRRR
jgi:hypothetical protein